MRIRKRHPLLASSLHSLPSTLPSDPHLSHPSPPPLVQLPLDSPPFTSDRPIIAATHHSPPSGDDDVMIRLESPEEKNDNHHDSRKGDMVGSQPLTLLPPPSPPSIQHGRWCEEEKTIPFKKRMRGSFENGAGKKVAVKARMKTKMNKKCTSNNTHHDQDGDGDGDGDDDDDDDDDYTGDDQEEKKEEARGGKKKKKKRGRGSAVMEGSRCSRVNGRGWRCFQQTLVGYSLCEHHLGKGRLRSMSSVRNRSPASSPSTTTTTTIAPPITTAANKAVVVVQPPQLDDATCLQHGNPLSSLSPSSSSSEKNKKKKRMNKLGMVKARSLSSLLEQTSSNAAT